MAVAIGGALGVLTFVVVDRELTAGSWTELIGALVGLLVGLLAAFFAYLAWQESRNASAFAAATVDAQSEAARWAKLAAEAQERVSRVAEVSLPVEIRMGFALRDGATSRDDTVIELELRPGTTRVWIHGVAVIGARFVLDDRVVEVDERFHDLVALGTLDQVIPFHLRPGVVMVFEDPFRSLHRGGPVHKSSLVVFFVAWSIERDDEPSVENGTVSFRRLLGRSPS
jgi:hypothetical protein